VLSIVVTWRDRFELAHALPGLVDTAAAAGGDITVVNFGGDPDLLAEQVSGHGHAVQIVHVENQRYFHKAKAQNLGIGLTRHPFLFFTDCDIVLEPASVVDLLEQVAAVPGTFATLGGVTESATNSRGAGHVTCFGYTLLIRTADGAELRIVDNEEDADDGTRNAPGLLLARRDDLLRIGGFNSCLHGWGWEDQDLIGRLTLGARLRRIISGRAIHLSHDDATRVAHYPIADRWESRDRMFREALANYDRADFSGTLDDDLRSIAYRVGGAVTGSTAASARRSSGAGSG